MGCGGRRECGEGIDNGSKRRIALLALGRVISSVGRGLQADFLPDHSSLEAVSGDRPWPLERFELFCKGSGVLRYLGFLPKVGLGLIEGFTPCPAKPLARPPSPNLALS